MKQVFSVTAKDGKIQKFNTYQLTKNGKYVTRFYVDNYKTHSQWTGKMCSFENQRDAIKFGAMVSAAVEKTNDYKSIKKLVELNATYRKTFGV